ncbi:MAG: tRNA (cmo5U34)-methyltransferase [Candidatus Saganbacteria bacterium]|uniref:tRNA (Cmo5U34)-methyltransferase n=1 Tax=Candidatus Saganbacteria bacterium TaxID=2575572 RepID=A0A833P2S8_UNCSA|nr:MAG: tRNA (cmo5U34)-methyltransferase [Candidatus Saganbacteria bacterium]
MKKVQKHFKQEALDFDEIIKRSIPFYRQMLEAIIDQLIFPKNSSPEILDLGTGTGEIAKNILIRIPDANLTIVDFVPEMLQVAKNKLSSIVRRKNQVRYIEADFSKWKFDQPYDAVVANLTLHHLKTERDKKVNYQMIFKNLKSSGILCVGDIILGTDKMLTELYIEKWIKFQFANKWSKKEIAERMQRYKTEDCPASLVNHLKWLEEIGFVKVDCFWKYYNFAVWGGRKG